jgi:hypothetical protein
MWILFWTMSFILRFTQIIFQMEFVSFINCKVLSLLEYRIVSIFELRDNNSLLRPCYWKLSWVGLSGKLPLVLDRKSFLVPSPAGLTNIFYCHESGSRAIPQWSNLHLFYQLADSTEWKCSTPSPPPCDLCLVTEIQFQKYFFLRN